MKNVSKLRRVYREAPRGLQPRIARLIDAVSNSEVGGVSAPTTKRWKAPTSALLALEKNSDSFLALMRTLPKKHPLKKAFEEIDSMSESLATKVTEAGDELDKLLSVDEDQLPGIKSSALGQLADLIKEEAAKLAELKELSSMLAKLSGKVNKEETTSPVEHELPEKEIGSEGEGADQGIGSEMPSPASGSSGNPAGNPAANTGEPAMAPAATPNLSNLS